MTEGSELAGEGGWGVGEGAEVGLGGGVEAAVEGVAAESGAPESQGREYAKIDEAEREPREGDEDGVAEFFEGAGEGGVGAGGKPGEQREGGGDEGERGGKVSAIPIPEGGGDDAGDDGLDAGAHGWDGE